MPRHASRDSSHECSRDGQLSTRRVGHRLAGHSDATPDSNIISYTLIVRRIDR